MARHKVTLSPDGTVLLVCVAGPRTNEEACRSVADTIEARAESGVAAIMFDTRAAVMPVSPEKLMARALDCGRRLERSRVAILANHVEDTYARIWRKGLEETGHEAMVFTGVPAAEAWLATEADAPMVYLS